jgi:hypothetical protein
MGEITKTFSQNRSNYADKIYTHNTYKIKPICVNAIYFIPTCSDPAGPSSRNLDYTNLPSEINKVYISSHNNDYCLPF